MRKMHLPYFFFIIVFLFHGLGCASLSGQKTKSRVKQRQSLKSMAEAVSGKDLTREELRKLESQVKTDKNARSAVEAISNSVSGRVVVKYCPVDGERYAAHLKLCPVHSVELKRVDE